DTPAAEEQRAAIRKAIADKVYEFDCHGVEMNQRYRSAAVQTDGEPEPAFAKDPELHCQPTSWPGARLPHAWVFSESGAKVSTLDLAGHGKFSILTGIGGRGWIDAAKVLSKEFGIDIAAHTIGPRQHWQDFTGDWARAREVGDSGILLVRPDHHVAWRQQTLADDPVAELRRVLTSILNK
ncbi:MAG: 2,4-dichlorophenol 6-monooxygenase, partial [Rhizobiaceae bacterium]|nr:2,4-dichlorophenol 6-monooxygenase [Rhizobiaceae bacterium]